MKTSSTLKILFCSVLLSYLLSGVLLIAASFALYKLRLKETQLIMMVNGIYILSSIFAGFLTGRKCGKQNVFYGLLAGLSYFLVLFIISLIMNQRLDINSVQILIVLLLCVGGGSAGGLISQYVV